MFKNNYIIGLGGTGGQAVAAFRRATVTRSDEYEALVKDRGVHFEYLYVDSNEMELNASSRGVGIWSIPGGDIRLNGSQRLDISSQNGFDLSHAQSLRNVRPWFGDGLETREFTVQGIQGAAQRRRYGRMLFANKAADFDAIISQGIGRLQKGSEDALDITYHIFATVGGGTGSGSLADVVSFLCQHGENAGFRYRTLLYLFVGGAGAAISNSSYFYQNEYAVLTDLNALMAGRYKPEIAAYPEEVILSNRENPISGIYISSEHGSTNSRSLYQQVECMANACFDVIGMMACGTGAEESQFDRAFTGEDLVDTLTGESTDTSQWDSTRQVPPGQTDISERSYRFRTIGVSRCKEPVDEMRNILKCTLYRQIIMHWLAGEGYKDGFNRQRLLSCESNKDIYDDTLTRHGENAQYMQNSLLGQKIDEYNNQVLKDFKNKFNLDDDKPKDKEEKDKTQELSKTEGIDFSPEDLQAINSYVRTVVNTIRGDSESIVRQAGGVFSSEMQRICENEADNLYKRIVQKLKERRAWHGDKNYNGGIWGLKDVNEYLDNLNTILQNSINNGVKFSTNIGNMEKREQQWRKIAGLTKLTSKQDTMYKCHYEEGRAVICRSLLEREEYIRMIMRQSLREKLIQLQARITVKIRELEALDMKQSAVVNECRGRMGKPSADVVCLYDAERLDKHVKYLTGPESEQMIGSVLNKIEKMMEVRNLVDASVEESFPEFGELEQKTLPEDGVGVSLWEESMMIHDDIVKRRPDIYKKAYHDTIFDALYELSATDRETELDRLLHGVETLAAIDGAPLGGAGMQAQIAQTVPAFAVAVCVPHLNFVNTSLGSFAHKVSQKLEDTAAAGALRNRVVEHDDPHEIRLIAVKYWLPARFFAVTRYLHDQNKNAQSQDVLYFSHIDDVNDEKIKPALVPTSVNPMVHELMRLVEIGSFMTVENGCPVVRKKRDEDVDDMVIEVLDADGLAKGLIHIHTFPIQHLQSADRRLADRLKASITTWLQMDPSHGKEVLEQMLNKHRELTSDSDIPRNEVDFLYSSIKKLESLIETARKNRAMNKYTK